MPVPVHTKMIGHAGSRGWWKDGSDSIVKRISSPGSTAVKKLEQTPASIFEPPREYRYLRKLMKMCQCYGTIRTIDIRNINRLTFPQPYAALSPQRSEINSNSR